MPNSLLAGAMSRRHAFRVIASKRKLVGARLGGGEPQSRKSRDDPSSLLSACSRFVNFLPAQGACMSNDNAITEKIRATLEVDDRIPHPGEVAVSERHGTVTLRGSVGSFQQRRTAVKIARSAQGVLAVEDELWVDPRDRWQDNEIRGAALQALMSSDPVPGDRVDVTVANGWLTLKGEVKHQDETDAAFDAVCRLPGVGGITNEIKVITAGISR
jgi:osmotically-inducible protein OsmY